jgi:pyruvate/2-oxoglutarate dehydrogenase complex dihydrolipoamide acyltransferase (E2) component
MTHNIGPHTVVDLPLNRRETPSLLDFIYVKHCMYGLLEVDVTAARRLIEAHKERTGEALSFTGYLAYCLARAIDQDKSVQAFLKGRKQLMLFEDVDVDMLIERKIGAGKAPMVHVIRAANRKSFLEIHREIRRVQEEPVPPGKGMAPFLKLLGSLPGPLVNLLVSLMKFARRRNPARAVAQAGTVGVTSVGMFARGRGAGWGLAPAGHPVDLIVGGIAEKPAVVSGRIEPRQILHLTVAFDHDVLDGGPAARFVSKLVELIECGDGLEA